MTKAEIDSALSRLSLENRKYRAWLPESLTFAGQLVSLEIDTESFATEAPPPEPSDELMNLARHVLAQVAPILQKAERAYIEYHRDYNPDALANASNPHLWLSVDALLDDGPTRWALVVGLKDAPDYGTHIEFDGAELVEVWSGD